MAQTVPVDAATYATLAEIARAKGIPLTEALARAIELYRREMVLEAVSAGYAALKSHPEAWKEELAERRAWDPTLSDGLEDE